mgnify:CR=1 FL=1
MEGKEFNKTWLAALLFCLLLGAFGAHRFYVGKVQTAVAMLLITLLTGWIFGLGFFISILFFLTYELKNSHHFHKSSYR